ncbi:MAG: DNA polymerase III subunit alpha [Thermodesulfovibrionales bacterium]
MHSHADYVPLHLHTEYSLLDGAVRIKELVERAKEFRLPAVAMTDHGNLFGAVDFYKQATKAGLKPIIGCEIYVAPRSRHEKSGAEGDEASSFHLILLARDNDGYRNLVTLVTKAYLEGFYYKPRIDMDLLEQYSGGLIALSACLKGEIAYCLQRGMVDRARERALAFKRIFGPENYYFEIQANGLPEQAEVNRQLIELGRELHIGLVATNDCHYLTREDAKAHEVLLCIQTGKTLKDVNRMKFSTEEFYLKSPDEMKEIFRDVPESVSNTVKIAERCNVEFKLKANLLPKYRPENGEDALTFMTKLAKEGLGRKVGADAGDVYRERLRTELEVIKKMGYESYFLIVWDFIHYARSRGIPVGPGRGSAAGSLVSYCLDITEIDPIKYNLLFERFLNPERISMPDIDVDFCQDRRNEVIAYVSEKYGRDHVAQIITFGTMAAKAAIRDVGRAMDMPYAEVDRIAKLVPATLKITLKDALKAEPQLKELYDTDDGVRKLIDIAMRLEGLNRHASTHAAGVVIAPVPLSTYTPLYRNPSDESIMTQFDMKAVEEIGLLKFDFLGLKTLTVIQHAIEYIRQGGTELSINEIPLDDDKTYELLSSGQTTGIFQLESEGMRDILVKMQPNRIEDLIALVALYRPGPIGSGMIDDFIKRKKGLTPVKYDLPQLKEILEETYGVILYQEQVMRIANKLANFSLGQADLLRRAMGKKNMDEMLRQKESFVTGAVKNGIPEKKASKIFDLLEKFAEYGFNKSHSAAYAFVSYQTAYLKAHYPVAFMAATLSLDMNDTDKIVKSINECRKMGIEILPPDINRSDRAFQVIGNSIRFGLAAVKGVGDSAIEAIVEARTTGGSFETLRGFVERVDNRRVNKKVIESLIKAGAFDSLGTKRAVAMNAVADLLSGAAADRNSGQQSIFGDEPEPQAPDGEEWEEAELLRNEKDALGFYITGHPLTRYDQLLARLRAKRTSDLEQLPERTEVIFGGIIRQIRKRNVKSSGELMAYIMLEDDEGSIEAVVFPDLYKSRLELLKKDAVVLVKGDIDRDDKGVKLRSREISRLEDAGKNGVRRIEVCISADWAESADLAGMRTLVADFPGDCQLYIRLRLDRQKTQTLIATGLGIRPDANLVSRLETLVGRGAVTLS